MFEGGKQAEALKVAIRCDVLTLTSCQQYAVSNQVQKLMASDRQGKLSKRAR